MVLMVLANFIFDSLNAVGLPLCCFVAPLLLVKNPFIET